MFSEVGKHAPDKLSTSILKGTSMAIIEEQFTAIYTRNMFIYGGRNKITHSE